METARFTPRSAEALSPALCRPVANAPLLTALGGDENAGFREQCDAIRLRWRDVHAHHIECAGHDHFSILDELTRAEGAIATAMLRLMQSFDLPRSS